MRSLPVCIASLVGLVVLACGDDGDDPKGGGGFGPGSGGMTTGSGGESSGTGGDATGMGGSGGAPGGSGGAPNGTGGAAPMCCASADCQPQAVTECVCVEWQQADCCSAEWGTFCQVTAEEKCGAEACVGSGDAKGPCGEPGTAAGCNDPATEQCVCALLPDCCEGTWDAVCAQLVNEFHCQESVRPCVCEEWEQATCCDMEWTEFCTITAEEKCGGVPADGS